MATEPEQNELLTLSIVQQKSQGIGFQIWPAAQVFCSFLENPAHFPEGFWRGKQVLELGSGCGVVGLRLASLGAHVVLSDVPNVLELTKRNVKMIFMFVSFIFLSSNVVLSVSFNIHSISDIYIYIYIHMVQVELNRKVIAPEGSVSTQPLIWGPKQSVSASEERHLQGQARAAHELKKEYDYVVCSDVVYYEHLFDPLLYTIAHVCSPHTQVLMCHEDRRLQPEADFFKFLGYSFTSEV